MIDNRKTEVISIAFSKNEVSLLNDNLRKFNNNNAVPVLLSTYLRWLILNNFKESED